MTAGFVHLPEEAQERRMHLWASISRDEPPAFSDGSASAEPGVRVVKADDVADWLRAHGGGFPRG